MIKQRNTKKGPNVKTMFEGPKIAPNISFGPTITRATIPKLGPKERSEKAFRVRNS